MRDDGALRQMGTHDLLDEAGQIPLASASLRDKKHAHRLIHVPRVRNDSL